MRLAVIAAATLVAACAHHAGTPATAQRMYVLSCGESVTTDVSRWSPGVNVGQSWEFSSN